MGYGSLSPELGNIRVRVYSQSKAISKIFLGRGYYKVCYPKTVLPAEMGIYRDNLSAIVIGYNLLLFRLIVIAQNSFNLSITDIAFVICFVIADRLSR